VTLLLLACAALLSPVVAVLLTHAVRTSADDCLQAERDEAASRCEP